MDPVQIESYRTSIQYCNKLLNMLEHEKDTIRNCFHGDPLKAYLKATDEAIAQVRKIRSSLQYLQARQQL